MSEHAWKNLGVVWLYACIGLGVVTFFVLVLRRPQGSPPSFWLRFPYVWALGVALLALAPNFAIDRFYRERQLQTTRSEDEAVKSVFHSFRGALKGRDGPAIWRLLDARSQAMVTQAAAELKAEYRALPVEKRREIERLLDLSEEELKNLDPVTYSRSRLFIDEHRSILEGEVSGMSSAGGPVEVTYRYKARTKSIEGRLKMTHASGEWLVTIHPPPDSSYRWR